MDELERHNLIKEKKLYVFEFIRACYKHNFLLATEILIEFPEIRQDVNDVGVPILIELLWEHNVESVELLLKNGFDPNVINQRKKHTPLFLVANKENTEIAKILLKYGADMYLESNSTSSCYINFICPFFRATEQGNIKFMKLMIENGFDPFYRDSHGKGIENYLPDEQDKKSKVLNFIKEFKLPEKFTQCDSRRKSPILTEKEMAITSFKEFCEREEFIFAEKILKTYPFLLNSFDNKQIPQLILFNYLHDNYVSIIEFLLKNGFNPNLRNYQNGHTSLMTAIENMALTIMETLIKNGADITLTAQVCIWHLDENTKENYGQSENDVCAYQFATHVGNIEAMALLIKYGMNPFYKDKIGRSIDEFLPPINEPELREKVQKFLEQYKQK